MNSFLKRFSKILLGLAIVAVGVAASALLWATRPIAQEKQDDPVFPTVEYQTVQYEPRSFTIPSQGIIEAARRSTLAAEVGGKVIETAPSFDPGFRVSAGDILLAIDPTDYLAAVEQARSNLAEAESTLATEQARSDQAVRDWKKLGRGGEPTDLGKRGPQVRAAEARVKSAEASLTKAEADLERATVTAPYDCVIASTFTELGSYLAPGSTVAEVFQTDPYEVRLPLSIDEVQFLNTGDDGKPTGTVLITAEAGGKSQQWTGRIIRTEGEIDRSSRSVYVVAEVSAVSDDSSATLQPGQFIKAAIPGREIPGLAAIPFSAFLDLGRVAIINDKNLLEFRETTVVFREKETVYISSGPQEGARLCITELSRMIRGDRVNPVEAGSLSRGEADKLETGSKL